MFHQGLSPEIGERPIDARVRDTHVHDSPHTRSPHGVEKRPRVGNGPVVGNLTAGEANPVCVVEGGNALEGFGQLDRIMEIERSGLYGSVLRRPIWMSCDRSHVMPGVYRRQSDRAPRVAEGFGHDVDSRIRTDFGFLSVAAAVRIELIAGYATEPILIKCHVSRWHCSRVCDIRRMRGPVTECGIEPARGRSTGGRDSADLGDGAGDRAMPIPRYAVE